MVRHRQALRCRAHRTDGAPCEAFAINGGTVCAAHGGRSPRVRQAAGDRLVAASLERQFAAAEQKLAARRADWWERRVHWAAEHLGQDPVQLVRQWRSTPVVRGWDASTLPWPVGLRREDEPQLQLDRRFGRRQQLGGRP